MRSHGLSRESSPYLEWDCEGTGSKLQRVPRALRFGLQLVVDQMLQTLKSCSVCRAPKGKEEEADRTLSDVSVLCKGKEEEEDWTLSDTSQHLDQSFLPMTAHPRPPIALLSPVRTGSAGGGGRQREWGGGRGVQHLLDLAADAHVEAVGHALHDVVEGPLPAVADLRDELLAQLRLPHIQHAFRVEPAQHNRHLNSL